MTVLLITLRASSMDLFPVYRSPFSSILFSLFRPSSCPPTRQDHRGSSVLFIFIILFTPPGLMNCGNIINLGSNSGFLQSVYVQCAGCHFHPSHSQFLQKSGENLILFICALCSNMNLPHLILLASNKDYAQISSCEGFFLKKKNLIRNHACIGVYQKWDKKGCHNPS